MAKMKPLDYVAIILLMIGGLNWGLFGFLNFNLVEWIADFIGYNIIAKILYLLVFLAFVYSGLRFTVLKK